MTSASEEKLRHFDCFFRPGNKQVVVRRDQIRRIGWVMKRLEAVLGQFILGYKCPVTPYSSHCDTSISGTETPCETIRFGKCLESFVKIVYH